VCSTRDFEIGERAAEEFADCIAVALLPGFVKEGETARAVTLEYKVLGGFYEIAVALFALFDLLVGSVVVGPPWFQVGDALTKAHRLGRGAITGLVDVSGRGGGAGTREKAMIDRYAAGDLFVWMV
jgi:hypothetical protein